MTLHIGLSDFLGLLSKDINLFQHETQYADKTSFIVAIKLPFIGMCYYFNHGIKSFVCDFVILSLNQLTTQ